MVLAAWSDASTVVNFDLFLNSLAPSLSPLFSLSVCVCGVPGRCIDPTLRVRALLTSHPSACTTTPHWTHPLLRISVSSGFPGLFHIKLG